MIFLGYKLDKDTSFGHLFVPIFSDADVPFFMDCPDEDVHTPLQRGTCLPHSSRKPMM